MGNSAHSRYGKSRNCVWSEGAVGNAISRDSRYFEAGAITGIRVAQLLGIPTKGRENFFIRERQLFSETKVNNKSPLQSLLFILEMRIRLGEWVTGRVTRRDEASLIGELKRRTFYCKCKPKNPRINAKTAHRYTEEGKKCTNACPKRVRM